ncbi:MAG: FAD-dependent oxidoreductase [Flavisolibacter sp.]|nr:FAD-dependent oxidoreductase [Flavisolibacter sp.]
MVVDYLIIGQGISGTMLSWYLYREGKTFLVIDLEAVDTPSRVAAGIINPVTGRRYVTTWMIEEVMPFSISAYTTIGNFLGHDLVQNKNIIDFFPSTQMREAFIERIDEDDQYLNAFPDQNHFNQYFNYDFGCGEISPCFSIDLQTLLYEWNKKLVEMNSFRQAEFKPGDLTFTADQVQYEDITAQKIIFCNGTGTMDLPAFQLLPFAPNKGETLLIECKDLKNQFIFKRSMVVAPTPEKDIFWVGSSYAWEFDHAHPTEQFLKNTKTLLDHWIKLPYKILSHKASVRPATLERRPFIGFHPNYPALGILNGMGSKGASLAPFFAHQLVQHIVHSLPITDEANVNRFSRILSK